MTVEAELHHHLMDQFPHQARIQSLEEALSVRLTSLEKWRYTMAGGMGILLLQLPVFMIWLQMYHH
jgi:hypothetical protein